MRWPLRRRSRPAALMNRPAPPAASGSAETDREALVSLYNTTDGENWAEPPVLSATVVSATVVRRTRGFRSPATFPICGERGGVPRRGRPLSPGSLAERAVRYGSAQYAHEGGYAAVARPVLWKGRLAKVVVVSVPDSDRAVLGPQLDASDRAARRRRPVAAGPW